MICIGTCDDFEFLSLKIKSKGVMMENRLNREGVNVEKHGSSSVSHSEVAHSEQVRDSGCKSIVCVNKFRISY